MAAKTNEDAASPASIDRRRLSRRKLVLDDRALLSLGCMFPFSPEDLPRTLLVSNFAFRVRNIGAALLKDEDQSKVHIGTSPYAATSVEVAMGTDNSKVVSPPARR